MISISICVYIFLRCGCILPHFHCRLSLQPLKDHILPYCADWRHPGDTLFLVAEEDWRLSATHDTQWQWTPTDVEPKRARELASPATTSQLHADRGPVVYPQFRHIVEPPADTKSDGGDPNDWQESGLGFYSRGQKPTSEEFKNTSQDLVDIVKIACEADRAGAGDLLWMSWMEATSRKKRAPSRFSGLIAISALGARKLLANFREWIPLGYFDVNLRKALGSNEDCRAKLAAGYLYPCLGHYSEHYAPGVGGTREAYWKSSYIAQGTRGPSKPPAAPWDGAFHVYSCIEKGHNPVMHPGFALPEVPGEDLSWWTAAITVPKLPAGREIVYRPHRKHRRNKVTTKYWVPKGITTPTLPPREQIDDSEAQFGEINVSSYQIVDDDEDTFSKDTVSFQRRWRQAVALFLRRSFTNDPEKVGICDMSFQPYYLSNSKLISCSAWGLSIVLCISISVSTFWRIPILRYIAILVCLHLDFHPHVHSIPILPLLPCNFPSRRMWDPSCRNASSLQPTPMEAKHSAFAKLKTKSLEMFLPQELPALPTSQQGRCRGSSSN